MNSNLNYRVRALVWGLLIIAIFLAPLAWSAIELLPAGWRIAKLLWPETIAELWLSGINAIAWLWGQWVAIELWRYVVILIVFTVATVGAYRDGNYQRFSCAVFYFSGLSLLGFALHWLAMQEWALFEVLAANFDLAFPDVSTSAIAVIENTNRFLGVFGTAIFEFLALSAAITFGAVSWSLVTDRLEQFQGELQSAFLGEVDPAFPRADIATARSCADARRAAISGYLVDQRLPPKTYVQVTFSDSEAPYRFVREYVERRQEVHPINPFKVAAFLEVPKGSPITAEPVMLDSAEDVAGQYVRLLFESEIAQTVAANSDHADDTLMPLLGRVVDAAILADQHVDKERDDRAWNAMPFFERIYLDYRPIPPPLKCFLGPLLGNVVPARVVIETHYPEVFRRALLGGKGRYGQYRKWFGVGVQIESPHLSQRFFPRLRRILGAPGLPLKFDCTPWSEASAPCRRLKSRVVGGVSGKLQLQLSVPGQNLGQPATVSTTELHVLSSGPLADGCPSVMSARPSPPAEPPIATRGGVSNAPAMWFLPPRSELHPSCKGVCVRSVPSSSDSIVVDLANLGQVHAAPSDVSRRYAGPESTGALKGKYWIGAFFDRDLRQASRFPLLACSQRSDDLGNRDRIDMRGAFAKDRQSSKFGGVIIAIQGPENALNLLLPQPLLNDYMTSLPSAHRLADSMPQLEEPQFVPSPGVQRSR